MGASNCVVCGVTRHGTPPHMNVVHRLPNQAQWRKFRVTQSLAGSHCMFCPWAPYQSRGAWSATWNHEMRHHAAEVEAISMHDPKWEAQWQEIQTARNGTGPEKVPAKLADHPAEAIPEPVTVEPKSSAGGMLAGLIEDISLVLNEMAYYKARCTDLEAQVRTATEKEVKIQQLILGLRR
jgi:hypothetical protein